MNQYCCSGGIYDNSDATAKLSCFEDVWATTEVGWSGGESADKQCQDMGGNQQQTTLPGRVKNKHYSACEKKASLKLKL